MKGQMISLAVMVVCFLLTGCERRELTYPSADMAVVPIHIDWSRSRVNVDEMNSASVWFFPKDGRPPFEYRLQEEKTDITVKLPVGEYSIICFNEAIDNGFKNIVFRGTDRYDSFEACVVEDTRTLSILRQGEEKYFMPPEQLAVWSLDNFTVTKDMVEITRTRANIGTTRSSGGFSRVQEEAVDKMLGKMTTITPVPVVRSIHIKTYVANLGSAVLTAVVFRGLSRGVLLSSGAPTYLPANHRLFISRSEWAFDDPDAPKDGTLEKGFLTFGELPEENVDYSLGISFFLIDNTWHPEDRFDVTKVIRENEEYEIVINVGRKEPGEPEPGEKPEDDHPIQLPEPSSLNQNVGVGDWNDEWIGIQ